MSFDSPHLNAVEAVLRLGSFEAAAAELNVTPSAISQRVRALEERVGAPLVIRSTPARGTDQGQRLARHAQERALLDAGLAAELGHSPTPARISIALNADSLETWAIPALAEAALIYDIVVEDETLSDVPLREGAVSAAVTATPRAVQGCDVVALGQLRYVATCAPAFRDRYFARGVTAQSLAHAPMLDFSGKDKLQRRWLRQVADRPLTPPTHHLPSSHGFVTAAVCGMGWALNPMPLVREQLASGALVPLLPGEDALVALHWQVRSSLARPLAPLTRAIRRAAAQAMEPLSPAG